MSEDVKSASPLERRSHWKRSPRRTTDTTGDATRTTGPPHHIRLCLCTNRGSSWDG